MSRPAPDHRPGYGEGRDALLSAVVRVVGRHGLRGLTYRAVAEEAGVTHGLVAHHFGSRERMIHEAAIASSRRSRDLSLLEPGSGRLDELAAELPHVLEEDEEPFRFDLELLLDARRRPEIRETMEESYDAYAAAVGRELARAGFDPTDDALARVVFAALDGIVLQHLLYGRTDETEASLARLRELLAASSRA